MDGMLYIQNWSNICCPSLRSIFWVLNILMQFMQNNDPKHTSLVAKAYYQEKDLNWWPTPAISADFNPIEHFWREFKWKHFIAQYVKLVNKKELIDGI